MGRLHKIGGISITVFGGDHLPPHFHAIGDGRRAKIELDGTVVYSTLRPKELKSVLRWAKANRLTIVAEWNRVTLYPVR
jgi:hypothetical protein